MAAAQPKVHLSPAEYYRRERVAEVKSEYFAGEFFAMAGRTVNHSRVKTNVAFSVSSALIKKGGGCEPFDSDLRVKVSQTGLRTYPDLTVICGPVETDPEDDKGETAINPTLIVEVLSDSTERYDRSIKFDHYQTIPTLKQYVLVSQAQPKVETYLRQTDGTWQYASFTGLEVAASLSSLGVTLPLAEVYRGVTFPPAPPLSLLERT